MSSEVYDCIVIGAGIQGSCTAYQLAKNKQKTLLLEQVGYRQIIITVLKARHYGGMEYTSRWLITLQVF